MCVPEKPEQQEAGFELLSSLFQDASTLMYQDSDNVCIIMLALKLSQICGSIYEETPMFCVPFLVHTEKQNFS